MEYGYPYNEDALINLAVIGGFAFLFIVFGIAFFIIVFGLKRNANMQKVKKWFWDEPRPNGQHKKEKHGAGKL